MNNCVGAANYKHFVLFLIYTWTASVLALAYFGINYFFCHQESCEFTGLLIHLVRLMTVLCFATLLFVSTILTNVVYSVHTGEGTIDRLKRKAKAKGGDTSDTARYPSNPRGRGTFLATRRCSPGGCRWIRGFWRTSERVYGYAVSHHAVWKEAAAIIPAAASSRRRRQLDHNSVETLDVYSKPSPAIHHRFCLAMMRHQLVNAWDSQVIRTTVASTLQIDLVIVAWFRNCRLFCYCKCMRIGW